MKYGHIAQMVFGKPWLILPGTLDTMAELLTFRMEGGRLSREEIEARLDAARPTRQQATPAQGVALIQLYGVIAPRASMLEDTSTSGTGLDQFMGAFRIAMADPEIGSIVLDIDSPGGQVGGIPEAAAEIRAARSVKPITSFANTGIGMASAAAYLGLQASEVVASPSSEVGSIGVRMVHQDKSGMYEQMGVKHTMLTFGKYKGEGNPYGPLPEETMAYAQEQIDTIGHQFHADLAKGRNLPISTVANDFGQGRMLSAKDALKVGMIDRIDTLDGVLRRELNRPKTAPKAAALLGPEWTAGEGIEVAEGETAELVVEGEDAKAPVASLDFELELHRRRTAIHG
jgi:signal peptide peptidase SppA